MFETIGDFDLGHDPFDGVQRDAVLHVLARLLTRFNLPLEQIRFHNQMTILKSCPGTSIQRSQTLQDVSTLLNGAEESPAAGDLRWHRGPGPHPQTDPGDVYAIVQQYLPAELNSLAEGEFLDILLYAHGGLVSESITYAFVQ